MAPEVLGLADLECLNSVAPIRVVPCSLHVIIMWYCTIARYCCSWERLMHCYAKMMRCHDSHMTSCILCAQDVYQTLSSCAWWGLGKRLSVYWHRQAVSAIATNWLLTPISPSTPYRTHNWVDHDCQQLRELQHIPVSLWRHQFSIPAKLNLCKEYCTTIKVSVFEHEL